MQTTDPPTKTPNHSFILAHQSGPEREKKCKKNSKKDKPGSAKKEKKNLKVNFLANKQTDWRRPLKTNKKKKKQKTTHSPFFLCLINVWRWVLAKQNGGKAGKCQMRWLQSRQRD